jgi:hypothetical protein
MDKKTFEDKIIIELSDKLYRLKEIHNKEIKISKPTIHKILQFKTLIKNF